MMLPDVEETPPVEKVDAPKAGGKTKWICRICGYVHEGDEPPEFCPRCEQLKCAFQKK